MKTRSFRNGLRYGTEFLSGPAAIANLAMIDPGQAVKMPSGAIYRKKGSSLIRTDKPPGNKKERRRLRAAAKLEQAKSIDQLQAQLAGEEA